MKLKLVSILIILLISCSSTKTSKEIIGFYKSKKYNFIEHYIILFSGKSYAIGEILKLKKDSTYVYNTCGNVISGYWRIRGDTLLLFCQKFRYKRDSLNRVLDTNCRGSIDKFYIHPNGELRQQFYVTIPKSKRKVLGLNYLVKYK